MHKQPAKRLTVRRETIKSITADQLDAVAGAAPTTTIVTITRRPPCVPGFAPPA
jgi:hypothetical protein